MDVRLKDVTVVLPPDDRLLFHIDHLSVTSGTCVLIHGASGLGKTTLLHLIAGLFLPEQGSVELGGRNLSLLSDHERARLRRESLGIIFQRLNLIEHLNALENVMLPLRGRSDGGNRAARALARANVGALQYERVGNLSLGEQQRVAVARVLAAAPDLILADEPTSSLDERTARAILDALREASEGKTMLVVSHDQRIAGYFNSVIPFEGLIKA